MSVDDFHRYLSMMCYNYGCWDKDQVTKIIKDELQHASDYKDEDHLKWAIKRRCQAEC
ncbi:MAG: hypothetical protein IJQ68_10475 [Methanobrevibacter sp.]|uniref:hypothetical protein n=1 Tax=Methanobrevibacter sp. TaxID=66852 RepID=UPI0025D38F04|nr:hypothetical protein [Methanobrevibacter sp.]MBR0272392.1 hypothetical protein [Methanobrevibacter sp.]